MTQHPMNEQELQELRDLLQLSQETEQKLQEIADLILNLDQKNEKQIAKMRVNQKLQSMGIIDE